LQGIAEALLVVKQHNFSGNRLRSKPDRLVKPAISKIERRAFPAPLALDPSSPQIAKAQPVDGEVPIGLGLIGIDR
jgi:hypothetical protein